MGAVGRPPVVAIFAAAAIGALAGCASSRPRQCPDLLPAAGITVSASAYASAHPEAHELLVCPLATPSPACHTTALRRGTGAGIFLAYPAGAVRAVLLIRDRSGTTMLSRQLRLEVPAPSRNPSTCAVTGPVGVSVSATGAVEVS